MSDALADGAPKRALPPSGPRNGLPPDAAGGAGIIATVTSGFAARGLERVEAAPWE